MRVAGVQERDELRGASSSGKAEIALVASAYAVYTMLRVVVEGSRATAIDNALRVLRVERALGLDWERSAQEWVLGRPTATSFWNFIYAWVYWPVVAIALVLLWRIDRVRYLLLRNTLMISAVLGLVIFGLFPVSPPRFLDGYVDTLAVQGDRLIAERGIFVNEYAAVPSFHVGWPAVAGLIVAWGSTRLAVWAAALGPALLLCPAVVFTGNHFVLDVLAGLGVSLIALALASRISTPQAVDRDAEQVRRTQVRRTHSSPYPHGRRAAGQSGEPLLDCPEPAPSNGDAPSRVPLDVQGRLALRGVMFARRSTRSIPAAGLPGGLASLPARGRRWTRAGGPCLRTRA